MDPRLKDDGIDHHHPAEPPAGLEPQLINDWLRSAQPNYD
jgi:hypothetical protein